MVRANMRTVLVVLVALCGGRTTAFLQDFLHPLQETTHEVKQALHLQPQQQQPQYQYKRAAYDTPTQQAGWWGSRPVLYQWLPSASRPVVQQNYATASSGAGGSSNPLFALWLPWSAANRQPSTVQPLSATNAANVAPTPQPQQPQQPFQAIWSFLPWNNNNGAYQTTQNPVLSFFQNPSGLQGFQGFQQGLQGLLPWGQASRPVIYTTPLAPAAPSTAVSSAAPTGTATQTLHVEVPVVSSPPSSPVVKPEGVVLDEATDNGIRRVALHQEGVSVPCA